MKTLVDFFPVILFFLAFKFYDLRVATITIMIATVLQMTYVWFKQKKLETMHIITLVVVLILGSATVLFKDDRFIKWKPSAIYWLLALVLLGSSFVGSKKPLIGKIFQSKKFNEAIVISDKKLTKLNWITALFFILLGIINLIVAYNFSSNTWVNFKLFGVPAILLLFILFITTFYLRNELSDKK